ncbi:unnamed protein product [Leptidea sinapis]|uniref:TLC domain-containing protein n=1 Tax=Leptidea sinapis TaxID=189913 RepID=A0A5E4QK80_9NEOP|nr:unnamed protein product [Leptidea sinapis]
MQLPELPPPPLAPLWDRVLRARTLPPDLDVQLLYIAIKDRLTHPEWEVRLHALRVLAELLPLSGNALSFPFDQVIDNLGHGSPNVRKAALDALKVFCNHCEDPICAANAIIDKCSYSNISSRTRHINMKVNVVTGLILSIPSLVTILKRRYRELDLFPFFQILGEKLFDTMHRDVALRSLMKMRRVCGPREYMLQFSRLTTKTQEKFRYLCEVFDEDSMDVYYAPRKPSSQQLKNFNSMYNQTATIPLNFSTDSSSEESYYSVPLYSNSNGTKVIIETEIKFDSDTAITMTVLEQNETESDRNFGSEEDNSDRHYLRYSEDDSAEDSDVVVKKVRFGGESVKIRTPDSDNLLNSEEDVKENKNLHAAAILSDKAAIQDKNNEIKKNVANKETRAVTRKSGIPLPVIQTKSNGTNINGTKNIKVKSKSLSELYDYFNGRKSANIEKKTSFALTLSDARSSDKVPSPVEPHREVEVLHNLQRSPTLSPRKQQTLVDVDSEGLLMMSRRDKETRKNSMFMENWIAAVKAADYLHGALLDADNVFRAEPAVSSLVQHMWALSDAVSTPAWSTVCYYYGQRDICRASDIPAAHAPAEGVVCALVRSSSADSIREILPSLIKRTTHESPPAALPHALLQRLALHHLVDLIFDDHIVQVKDPEEAESARLRAAMCFTRAAGPAAVLAAVRRRLGDSSQADEFCNKLRERLNRPVDSARPSVFPRVSHLPVSTRRRARSTPPAAPRPRTRKLRPLPESAPLLVNSADVCVEAGASQKGGLERIGGMRRLCCCGGRAPVYPEPPYTPDLVADLPPHTRDSSASSKSPTNAVSTTPIKDENSLVDAPIFTELEVNNAPSEETRIDKAPSTPSIHLDDYSEKSNKSHQSDDENEQNTSENIEGEVLSIVSAETETQIIDSATTADNDESNSRPLSEKSIHERPKSFHSTESARSLSVEESEPQCVVNERDVRVTIAECILPTRHEDWEAIVKGLSEIEGLAADTSARAPASSWRSAVRAAAAHVRSLRSKVARAACSTLGSLYENRGKVLEPEVEEATTALLERCADVNRFLRAEAANALGRVACGAGSARAGVALARRGASHRAGPIRAAAAQALAKLTRHTGPSKILELPTEPRIVILKAAGELLADAHPETRLHARNLCLILSEDLRFRQLLKDSMTLSRYRAIEKPEVSIATLLKLTSFVCWSWSYILCVGLRPGKTPEWYSRAVTMVHGSVASIIALWQCDALNLTADRFTDKITLGQYALMLWSWGYFAFDLLWCLVYWSDSYVMLCHHICALIAIDIYMSKENTGCTFPCTMALMEVTNPLLQTRWFMKSEGYTNSILYYVIEGVYLLLFLFLRGVLGTYLTYNILHSEKFDMDEKMITLAFYVVSLIFIFQIIGYVAYKYKTKIEEFKGILEEIGLVLNGQW